MGSLRQDAIFAIRVFRKHPGSTVVAIVAIALGIGANATVFTIANAFLFQNLPFTDSQRVLYISGVDKSSGDRRGESWPDFRDFQSGTKTFGSMGAFSRADLDLSDNSALPFQYKGARVTVNTFAVIRKEPIVGRGFLPEDAIPGAQPVAVLSYSLWESRYGGNRSIIGETIRVNEIPTIVVGVMPPGIEFPGATRLWMPLVPGGDWQRREYRRLTVFGRLAPNARLAAARAEIAAVALRLETQYPATNRDIGANVQTWNDYFNDSDTRVVFFALLGAVGFVLLIACANIANLLLARAAGRLREISIRAALGAGRWRVIRQLLVESVILATAGGVPGIVAGLWSIRFFRGTLIPEDTPSFMTFAPDFRVIAFLAAITVGAGILFGLAPALGLSRSDISGSLTGSGAGWTRAGRTGRASSWLVVAEMALSFVLLAGAGLMVRSFLNMAYTPMGVRVDHLMSMDLLLRPSKYPSDASRIAFHERLTARLARLPGVEGVAMASNLPGDGWTDFNFEPEGDLMDARRPRRTGAVIVSPSYFAVMEVHPRRGRAFLDSDRAGGIPVAIVNESFARTAWPGRDALGKRLRLVRSTPGAASAMEPWRLVVGIVPDIVQSDTTQGAHDPLIYLPYSQLPQREMVIAARTLVPPETLGNAFRRQVQALDPDLPVTDLRTLDRILWERTRSWRVYGSMFSIFAGIALIMGAVGLYAVVAHSVSQRTQEIGVRIAMGAPARRLFTMVFAQGMRQLLLGLVLGLAASFALTRVLASQLIGVAPADPATLTIVALILTAAGLTGSLVPALRAIHVDPTEALRRQ